MLRFATYSLLAAVGVVAGCQQDDETPTPTSTSSPAETAEPTAAVETVTETFAGSGDIGVGAGGYVDGALDVARFRHPAGLALGEDGAIYVADSLNGYVRRIADGQVTTVAGTGDPEVKIREILADQPSFPSAVAVRNDGTVFIVDSITHRVFALSKDGRVNAIAGGGAPGVGGGGFVDGRGSDARFSNPVGIAVLPDGSLVVADKDNHAIRSVSQNGMVETLAGGPSPGFKDGPFGEALFAAPVDVAVADDGTIFVLDQANNAIRMLKDGQVTTVVGGGAPCDVPPDCKPGDVTRIFTYPAGFGLGVDNAIYVADGGAQRIVRVALTEAPSVTVVAGSRIGERGLQDGADALFDHPSDVLYDPDRGVFVSDSNNHRIRLIRP